MKSLRKKLFLSILAVAFAVVSLATSTFAWFSMNTSVKVSGMEVKTKVSSNLMISATNVEANYTTGLTQARSALLEPVSSVNGKAFFYHANGNMDAAGKVSDEVYTAYNESVSFENSAAGKANLDYDFNTRYSINGTGEEAGETAQAKWLSKITDANKTALVAPAYGYVDYTFFLKATSDNNDADLRLTTVNLMYNNAAIVGSEKAWRVAVFKEDVEKGASGSAVDSMALVSILTLDGAGNYYGTAASSPSARSTVTYNDAATIKENIAAGTTEYYKVVVRLWLEGEDSTCNNETYASLNSSWKLELEFKLDTTSSSANKITSSTTIIG